MKPQFPLPLPRRWSGMARTRCAAEILLAACVFHTSASPAAPTQEQADAALQFAHAQQARLQKALEMAPEPRLDALLKEVRRTFDFSFFTEESLGSRWAGLSAQQKRAFHQVLQELIERWYMKQTEAIFAKGGASFNGARPSPGGVDVVGDVNRDGTVLGVVMRLHNRSGAWMVYDVVVDELSFLESYRSQFLKFLEDKDPDSLIAQLRIKADAASPLERDEKRRRQSTKDR